MKENYSDQEKFISKLLIFVFVFIVLVITILSLHYAGILSLNNGNQNTNFSTDTLETTSSEIITDHTPLHSNNQTTRQTSESTKYLPATVPTFISSQSASTKETSSSEQTSKSTQTTESTQSSTTQSEKLTADDISDANMSELITKKYLSIHKNSRPGYKLWSVKNIVVHYVANPGSTALQNWKNFENNKPGTSSHFIIGIDGTVLQCMPLDEVAWAIGTTEGNYTTISIECCHPDSTGKFTDATYESLIKLVSWLCAEFDLTEDNVKRHYDYPRTNSSGVVWHKHCPLYYVNHPEQWEAFKDDLYIP